MEAFHDSRHPHWTQVFLPSCSAIIRLLALLLFPTPFLALHPTGMRPTVVLRAVVTALPPTHLVLAAASRRSRAGEHAESFSQSHKHPRRSHTRSPAHLPAARGDRTGTRRDAHTSTQERRQQIASKVIDRTLWEELRLFNYNHYYHLGRLVMVKVS